MMDKLLIICGPTATGKTALGIKLAKAFKAEIVSADSRQIYKGMDIGTGKEISKIRIQKLKIKIKNQKLSIYKILGVPLWLWDVVRPDCRFSAADYVEWASLTIRDIWKREKLPILVGGTGFYIKALIDGMETIGIPPDWKLRKKLQSFETPKLQEILEKLAPERWEKINRSDKNNPRRLIRAIEINLRAKNSLKIKNCNLKIKSLLMLGLKAENKILYQRIDARVEKRVKEGVVDEIKGLLTRGFSWKNSALGSTIGYKEFEPYFKGEANLEKVIQKWKYDEHYYARRQMTWFKKDKRIYWFDIFQSDFEKKIVKLTKKWYSKSDAKKS